MMSKIKVSNYEVDVEIFNEFITKKPELSEMVKPLFHMVVNYALSKQETPKKKIGVIIDGKDYTDYKTNHFTKSYVDYVSYCSKFTSAQKLQEICGRSVRLSKEEFSEKSNENDHVKINDFWLYKKNHTDGQCRIIELLANHFGHELNYIYE